ncbi:MAG TPA: NADH-quinone oxidoreductase subunit N [Bacteroidota bacterium]|nr:NADH-quinone oxidoreductase subunit N [Bacteroidota bacterium]
MVFVYSDIEGVSPILILSLTALAVLVIKAAVPKGEKLITTVSVAGIFAGLAAAVWTFPRSTTAFSDMTIVGGFASFFDTVFLVIALLTIMHSVTYLKKVGLHFREFYALVLFAVIGMMLMSSAADLITIFLGLELMSVSFYVLAGFMRTRGTSNEAAMKYFLLGAFATGFLLYGIALIYGCSGTTSLMRLAIEYPRLAGNPWCAAGFGLLLIGFGFKVAAFPFHMWAPDVYEGSPTTVSGLMATGGKAAAFSAFVLVFAIPMSQHDERLGVLVALLAAGSMIVGNVLGLAQTNLKRMLAYSSIAHAGYMLIGIASGQSVGEQGILFYLVSYALTTLGAFGVISILEDENGGRVSYEDYAGLGARRPALAAMMSCFMFSLTGMPPFSGFIGKYYLFTSAVQSNLTWLAILGVVTSLISAYYYLRVVVVMYFRGGESGTVPRVAPLAMTSLGISVAGILILGVLPSLVLNVTRLLF